MASIRRELIIDRPAGEVWGVMGDPGSLAAWFPGIASCDYEQSSEDGVIGVRRVTTRTGLQLTEDIVTLDPLIRRLQYRIVGGALQHHLATLDVIPLSDSSCLAVYGTDAEPAVMALVLGGAAGEGLSNVARLLDSGRLTNA